MAHLPDLAVDSYELAQLYYIIHSFALVTRNDLHPNMSEISQSLMFNSF